MRMQITSSTLNSLMFMVTALAVCYTAWVNARSKAREEAKAEANKVRDEKLAEAIRVRDEKLAEGTAAVAAKAAEVAAAAVTVKESLDAHDQETLTHRNHEEGILKKIEATTDRTHVIVNAQKTAMMQKLQNAQLLTLTMAKAMLKKDRKNRTLKSAVATAQALYDESARDLARKEEE
jgi:hypothetical protein